MLLRVALAAPGRVDQTEQAGWKQGAQSGGGRSNTGRWGARVRVSRGGGRTELGSGGAASWTHRRGQERMRRGDEGCLSDFWLEEQGQPWCYLAHGRRHAFGAKERHLRLCYTCWGFAWPLQGALRHGRLRGLGLCPPLPPLSVPGISCTRHPTRDPLKSQPLLKAERFSSQTPPTVAFSVLRRSVQAAIRRANRHLQRLRC